MMIGDTFRRKSVLSLLAVNSVPIFGMAFFGWNLFSVVFFYWLENVVIGFFNVLRMIRAERPLPLPDPTNGFKIGDRPYEPGDKTAVIVFFIVHYGIFTVVHGAFIAIIFGEAGGVTPASAAIGALSLFVSHAVSYVSNYIGKGEYRGLSAPDLFVRPYGRIIALHAVVLFGGLMVKVSGSAPFMIIMLIASKTIMDVVAHERERKKFVR